ncbi:MAG: hypothetical protein ACRD8W_07620 [Nitrososphaeraceae archaeon]
MVNSADDADSITGPEWEERSKRGKLCGVFGCEQQPEVGCQKCEHYFCKPHFDDHPHIV